MPIVRYVPGHAASVKGIIDYLAKQSRTMDIDYVNCFERDRRGDAVWKQMDICRRVLGTNQEHVSRGRARSYMQIVVSPDPRDHVSMELLRDLTLTWAKESFPKCQMAIFYHDDNALRIAHSHIVLNNALLDGSGSVGRLVNYKAAHALHGRLQELSAERGLRTVELPSRRRKEGEPELLKPRGSIQHEYRSRRDRQREAQGISWKEDLRERMAVAIAVSKDEDAYLEACQALGLAVRESESRLYPGELVYTHPGSADWNLLGSRLGRDWSRWGIARALERDEARGLAKPDGPTREALLSCLRSLRTVEGDHAFQVLGVARGVEVRAKDVLFMLRTCSAHDIQTMADFGPARRHAVGDEERDALDRAQTLAQALGHLRDKRGPWEVPWMPALSRRALESSITGAALRERTHPVPAWPAVTDARDQTRLEPGLERT